MYESLTQFRLLCPEDHSIHKSRPFPGGSGYTKPRHHHIEVRLRQVLIQQTQRGKFRAFQDANNVGLYVGRFLVRTCNPYSQIWLPPGVSLYLDPQIRDWVLFPITLVMVSEHLPSHTALTCDGAHPQFSSILRHSVVLLLQSPPKSYHGQPSGKQ